MIPIGETGMVYNYASPVSSILFYRAPYIYKDNTLLCPVENDSFEFLYPNKRKLSNLFEQSLYNPIVDVDFKLAPVVRGINEQILHIFDIIKNRAFIAGGYAAYMLAPATFYSNNLMHKVDIKAPTDIDIYAVNCFFIESISLSLQKIGYKIETQGVSITLKHSNPNYLPVQIVQSKVTSSFTSPEQTIDNFDFSIIRAAVFNEQLGIADVAFDEDYSMNLVRIRHFSHFRNTFQRMVKYARKGYVIPSYTFAQFANLIRINPNYFDLELPKSSPSHPLSYNENGYTDSVYYTDWF